MAEAPIKWKIELLKRIIDAPLYSHWIPTAGTQEIAWFIDMQKDGYVEGNWGQIVSVDKIHAAIAKKESLLFPDAPEGFSNLHVTEKGKKLVFDYNSQNTFSGIWKRYHKAIFIWILTIASAIVIECLRTFYFH